MSIVTLQAHFDGNMIVLDEEYDLKPDTRLIVTILPDDQSAQLDTDREIWFRWAMEQFNRGYGDEPEYTLDMIKEWNPRYDGR